ncbi:MAG TPA: YfhO family protein [Thermoanaerobaculia bacterium]|nr:YfhO family protein [Thermoanaerobaculia bacterium]
MESRRAHRHGIEFLRGRSLNLDAPALALTYAATAAFTVALASRFVARIPRGVAILLLLLPLVFTGEAVLQGRVYGPVDLYNGFEPWKGPALERGAPPAVNPILSDLAFANLPWRAAVRESIANGRAPLWNRFILAGNPLLGSAGAAVFHPATWLAVFLPVPLSWTFTCAFTLFLALICGWLFFRDLGLDPLPALVGAVGWAFSTYMVFFLGWSVGLSTASFPLLLLGVRRIAERKRGVGITVAAFLLSFAGGHPESTFHILAAAAVYFAYELFRRGRRGRAGALGASLLAALLGLALAAPQLLPILEAVQHSAEYRTRRQSLAEGHASQSVAAGEAARRLLPAVLPFAHGIYGKSPVQAQREDGSGMPLAYGGAVLFALAGVGFFRKRGSDESRRGRAIFFAFTVAGLLLGASAPGLLDLLTRLPLFSLALNYRLVFLAGFGLSALAALGAERILRDGSGRTLARSALVCTALLGVAFLLSRGVFRERGLSEGFVRGSFAREVVPLVVLAAAAALPALRGRRLVSVALLILVAQRGLEMGGTYPTLPRSEYAPPLPTLATLPVGEPYRVVATGDVLRPNGSALYGLEDVRGYESLLLARYADTYPFWSEPQFASFNRVDDLSRPFLSFLNARFAIASADGAVPPGWREWARGKEMAIFENPRALPRAFVPRRVRSVPDPARSLEAMSAASDFFETAWVAGEPAGEVANGPALLSLRSIGPDLHVTAEASETTLVATSLPDWPGWEARAGSGSFPVVTVNHAFVGFRLPPGRHAVRLSYRPDSFRYGLVLCGAALAALAVAAVVRRRSSRVRPA